MYWNGKKEGAVLSWVLRIENSVSVVLERMCWTSRGRVASRLARDVIREEDMYYSIAHRYKRGGDPSLFIVLAHYVIAEACALSPLNIYDNVTWDMRDVRARIRRRTNRAVVESARWVAGPAWTVNRKLCFHVPSVGRPRWDGKALLLSTTEAQLCSSYSCCKVIAGSNLSTTRCFLLFIYLFSVFI